MAALTQILQSITTSTGATNGTSFAIDSTVFTTMSPDWTIGVEVRAIDPNVIARFSIQDSVNAFASAIAGPTFEVEGQTGSQWPRMYSFTRKQFPGLRFGVASAVMRVSLVLLQGVIPHVTWAAYYQGPFSN